MKPTKHLLVGCSFTDPVWQKDIPWSVEYAKTHPSYIVAKAGMGIKGICTEAMYYLPYLDVSRVIIMLPTLWRLDVEMDEEARLCNAMVDLLYADQSWTVSTVATRKWIVSGGVHYSKNTEYTPIFDFLYKHQGFLVIAKEHLRALTQLIEYCKMHSIEYAITAIQDPLAQLAGLDYIRNNISKLLDQVEYNSWIRFDGKFVDQYLKHTNHPSTKEHQDLCSCIVDNFKQGNNHG
jgi:hypothetical protein